MRVRRRRQYKWRSKGSYLRCKKLVLVFLLQRNEPMRMKPDISIYNLSLQHLLRITSLLQHKNMIRVNARKLKSLSKTKGQNFQVKLKIQFNKHQYFFTLEQRLIVSDCFNEVELCQFSSKNVAFKIDFISSITGEAGDCSCDIFFWSLMQRQLRARKSKPSSYALYKQLNMG